MIWVAADGENAIVSTALAAHALEPADVAAVGALGPADTLLMQGNIPIATTAHCLELAGRRGARLVVNTAPLVRGAELLVPMADVLVVNAGEAAGLSGERSPRRPPRRSPPGGPGASSSPWVPPASTSSRSVGIGTSRLPASSPSTPPGPATCSRASS